MRLPGRVSGPGASCTSDEHERAKQSVQQLRSLVFRLTQDAFSTQEDIMKSCRFDASMMRSMLLYARTESVGTQSARTRSHRLGAVWV